MADHVTEPIRETLAGFACAGLRNEQVELLAVPDLGAKVIRLQHRRGGRQWMWRSGKDPELFAVPPGTTFDAGPLLGADECLPTVAACRWSGRSLPDHGEAWAAKWTLDDAALERGDLVTELRLPISPLTIRRSITLHDNAARFAYELTNVGNQDEAYVWALHPMLTIQPGDRLQLPESVGQVRTELVLGDAPLGERGDAWSWPRPAEGLDFAALDLGGPDRAVKLFTEPLGDAGWARLANPDTGEAITFRFDPRQLDTLGLWINRGAFGGYQHVAIEPTNGAPDALNTAVQQWRRFSTLKAGETRSWWLEIELAA